MGSLSLMHWVVISMILSLPLIVAGVPVARILRRVGFSRWWCLLCLLPYGVGILVGVWVLAFIRWPALDGASQQSAVV